MDRIKAVKTREQRTEQTDSWSHSPVLKGLCTRKNRGHQGDT